MTDPDFYLTSTEGYGLEEIRRCWRERRIATPNRDDLLLVRVDPPLPSEIGGAWPDRLIVASRHKGYSLFPVREWPGFVHVARLLEPEPALVDPVRANQYELIGWAEIYATEEAATAKRMT